MIWTSCKDRLPPVGEQVLAYGPGLGEMVSGANIEIVVWDGTDWWDEGGTELADRLFRTWTHWMPLPTPPNTHSEINNADNKI